MVLDKVKEIICDQLGVDADSIEMNTSITDDLSADSLDMIETLMAIEDEFDLEIPDEEVENLKTVGDLVNYIQNNTDEN